MMEEGFVESRMKKEAVVLIFIPPVLAHSCCGEEYNCRGEEYSCSGDECSCLRKLLTG
jgi:hypothetical protein